MTETRQPRKQSEIVIRFRTTRTHPNGQLLDLLLGLHNRATVESRMILEIDGERQAWLDELEDQWERNAAERRESHAEWDRENLRILVAVLRNPGGTDEEIAAVAGCHPLAVGGRRYVTASSEEHKSRLLAEADAWDEQARAAQ